MARDLASFLSLSSNNRVISFYWIRGGKHCFLTSFSYLNCYFCFLVFSSNHYLLVSLCLSWLHRNPISHPVFSYLYTLRCYVVRAPPLFGHTSCIFSKQDAHGNLVLDSVPVFFPVSPFTEGFSREFPLGNHKSYLFFSLKILELTLSCVT